MDHSGRPHAEQQRKSQTTNCKKIDHKIDPERCLEADLGEHAKRWDEQSDDDAEDVATGHCRLAVQSAYW